MPLRSMGISESRGLRLSEINVVMTMDKPDFRELIKLISEGVKHSGTGHIRATYKPTAIKGDPKKPLMEPLTK